MIEFDNILRKLTILITLTLHYSNKTKPWRACALSTEFQMYENHQRQFNQKLETRKTAYIVSLDQSYADNFNHWNIKTIKSSVDA